VQHQVEQRGQHRVALLLRRFCQGVDRPPRDIVHRQDAGGGQLFHRRGHQEARVVGQQIAIVAHLRRLAHIVGLFVQLALGLFQQRRDVERGGQQVGQAQQRGHIVHIGIDAGGNARILHLDRQFAAIGQAGPVDLPDRGGGQRARVEVGKAAAPVRAPFGIEHFAIARAACDGPNRAAVPGSR
jgi:hypothetical protein